MQYEPNEIERAGEALAEELRPRVLRQAEIRSKIVEGLAPNGKSLRRNAPCPCGSGKKFKKCCLHGMKAAINDKATKYRNAKIERFDPTDETNDKHRHNDSERPSIAGDDANVDSVPTEQDPGRARHSPES